MSLVVLAAAALKISSWQYSTHVDPLGQTVYIAESLAQAEAPRLQLRFSCGGIVGVELQYNLGQASFSERDFSLEEPAWEDVSFAFPEGPYPTTSKKAPLTDGIGTFEIKGGDAMFIANLFRSGGSVDITHGDQQARFSLEGASVPITQVIESCPFKYVDQ